MAGLWKIMELATVLALTRIANKLVSTIFTRAGEAVSRNPDSEHESVRAGIVMCLVIRLDEVHEILDTIAKDNVVLTCEGNVARPEMLELLWMKYRNFQMNTSRCSAASALTGGTLLVLAQTSFIVESAAIDLLRTVSVRRGLLL